MGCVLAGGICFWGDWWVLLYRVLGEVSGSMLVGTLAYEPESLILAQSERWRNA